MPSAVGVSTFVYLLTMRERKPTFPRGLYTNKNGTLLSPHLFATRSDHLPLRKAQQKCQNRRLSPPKLVAFSHNGPKRFLMFRAIDSIPRFLLATEQLGSKNRPNSQTVHLPGCPPGLGVAPRLLQSRLAQHSVIPLSHSSDRSGKQPNVTFPCGFSCLKQRPAFPTLHVDSEPSHDVHAQRRLTTAPTWRRRVRILEVRMELPVTEVF